MTQLLERFLPLFLLGLFLAPSLPITRLCDDYIEDMVEGEAYVADGMISLIPEDIDEDGIVKTEEDNDEDGIVILIPEDVAEGERMMHQWLLIQPMRMKKSAKMHSDHLLMHVLISYLPTDLNKPLWEVRLCILSLMSPTMQGMTLS